MSRGIFYGALLALLVLGACFALAAANAAGL